MDTTIILTTYKRYLGSIRLWFSTIRRTILSFLNTVSGMVCLSIAVLLLLDFSFKLSIENKRLFASIHTSMLIYFFIDVFARLLFEKRPIKYLLTHPTDVLIFYPIFYFFPSISTHYSYLLSHSAMLLLMLGRIGHLTGLLKLFKIKPTQLFLLGFVFTIFIGALLLSLPISTKGVSLHFIDALFTAFSAVCVTGLVVNDISTVFSTFGQSVILLLIQIGGLGIMTFSVLLALLLQHKVSQGISQEYQESYSTYNLKDTFKTMAFIFKSTLILEAVGALLLFLCWHQDFPSYSTALFYAIFHAVSAFCNAGFSLFSDSLVSYASHIPTMAIISILIIGGGLGFPVLFNLYQYAIKKESRHLKLQTKLALLSTLILIVLGTVLFFIIECHQLLQGQSFLDQLSISLFQSISARTAGFNSIDLTQLHVATLMMMMVLMLIGASPGSTGGGIKTTTCSIMLIALVNTLKSSKRMEIMGRTIPIQNVLKAYCVFCIFIVVMMLGVFAFSIVESQHIFYLIFETVSAIATVGFSLDITSQLSAVGKGLTMLLMFMGRLGPLTIAIALSQPKADHRYAFPKERIMIG